MKLEIYVYCGLLRCCTARGSIAWLSWFSPTKDEARKSFLFTESSLVLKLKNTGFEGVKKPFNNLQKCLLNMLLSIV